MASREMIIIEGEEIIHFVGNAQKDVSLCHYDLAGDYNYSEGVGTNKKVNCKDCIAIVEYCKRIKSSEYEKPNIIHS